MCGILGYVGSQDALPLLLEGLGRMDYRGYDSAGVAIFDGNRLHRVRSVGSVQDLQRSVNGTKLAGRVGIAHTRWATHGAVSERNAHPHLSCDGTIALVHNGVVENHAELRAMLQRCGHRFASDTDTEALVHLLEKFMGEGNGLLRAVQMMNELVVGAYGIAALTSREPGIIVAARHGSPLLLGLAPHGIFVSSDSIGFRQQTDQAVLLEDGQMVVIGAGRRPPGYSVLTLKGNTQVDVSVRTLEGGLDELSKGEHAHFMLKEIKEQPNALRQTIAGRLVSTAAGPEVKLGGMAKIIDLANGTSMKVEEFNRDRMNRVVITACGTSLLAGMVGARMLQKLLRVHVDVAHASEFATSHELLDANTFVIDLSQSGETKDTIEAVKRSKSQGAVVWNICNVVESALVQLADSGMYLRVGPEIGVASTKAFTAQVVALALVALKCVELRNPEWVTAESRTAIATAIRALPDQVQVVLDQEQAVKAIAATFIRYRRQKRGTVPVYRWRNALYLGRGYNLPTALEGALKLKEISYIHAEGYPGGEMKHGPIALIDADMPVVIIAPLEGEDETTYAKIMGNLEEVHARKGRVILIASEGDEHARQLAAKGRWPRVRHLLTIPHTLAMFTPVLASVYCQLLAYHIAALKGCPIDKPRNLAKAVTVE